MRTTIELTDRQRARLLAMAAERGEKGFSGIVQQAIDAYLAGSAEQEERRRRALDALGVLDERAGRRLEKHVTDLRQSWR